MLKFRNTVSLNGEWEFAYTKHAPDMGGLGQEEDFRAFPADKSYEIRMPVPGYWDDYEERLIFGSFWSRGKRVNPDFQPFTMPIGSVSPPDMSLPWLLGCGWYRKRFWAEADWGEKSVVLHVGGVTMEAYIWLNGRWIGHHEGHLTPFSYSLSGALIPGEENELLIAVSNTRTDRSGCSIRGNKGRSAGITRPVFLEVTGKQRLEDVYVYPDASMEKLLWQAEVSGEGACEIRWEVLDTERGRIADCGTVPIETGKTSWESSADKLERWSDNSPKLYRLRLELVQDGIVEDEMEQSFGLRLVEAKGQSILLNKRPVFLRGATEHAYFPMTCTVPMDRQYYVNAIKTLKSYGFNWMRFHTWVPPLECLEAADELGMLIQVEMANGFAENEWQDAVLACRRHPSVIIYCCGNEVRMDEKMLPYLEKMAECLHRQVPDVLFNPMEGLRGIEYDVDDAHTGFHEELFRYDRLERLDKFSDVYAPHGHQFSYHSLAATEEAVEKNLGKFHKPCLIHEACINDTYLNLDLEKRYEGTRIGTKLYSAVRAYTERMGVLDRTPIYYRNSCLWMKQVMKYSLENARRSNRVSGYDLLGAIDFHWHRSGYGCGFMNEFYELKEGFAREEILSYNGESVLLASVGKNRNVRGGQELEIPVQAALYGENAAKDGVLSYYLGDGTRRVYCSGKLPIAFADHYTVTQIALLRLVFPKVERPEKVRLKLHFDAQEYQLDNSWDYWVFPEEAPYFKESSGGAEAVDAQAEHKVLIVQRLDKEAFSALAAGARVLLFGSGPFPSVRTSFQIMTAGRPQGLNATVIYEHPVTKHLPHEGFCDWQFQPMMDGGETVVFNDAPVPFVPIVEMVSGYKIIRKQASMFEMRVGKGGLFVCSLNMKNQDAGTLYLRKLLERYIASEEFCPTVEIAPEGLLAWCRTFGKPEIDFSTDEGYDEGGHVRKESQG